MTLYYNTLPRFARRHWMERMLENEMPVAESEVRFPVDILAGEDDFTITAMLPGLKAEDLSIQIVNETVTLQGEFKDDRDEKAEYLLTERPSGHFSRTLTLSVPLDAGKAEAEMKNGILTLRIPKAEDAKPRTIKVVAK